MDRLYQLSTELTATLDELQREAQTRNIAELAVPLAWLDEANGWLKYELARLRGAPCGDEVTFTYVPLRVRN